MADPLFETLLVNGTQLLQQDHRILDHVTFSRGQLHMGRQFCLVHAGSDGSTDHSGAVPVAHIVLNNKYRADASLLASHHRAKIRIKNIPSFNYHTIHTPFYFNFFTPENKYFQLFSCVYMCGVLLFNQNTLILRIPLRP